MNLTYVFLLFYFLLFLLIPPLPSIFSLKTVQPDPIHLQQFSLLLNHDLLLLNEFILILNASGQHREHLFVVVLHQFFRLVDEDML
jgi:hypothetical protein